jgi:hypothetical protein
MERSEEQPTQRDVVADDIEAIVESDTDTLADAVSRDDISRSELELLCREADAGAVNIDEDVLPLVRIVTSLLTRHGERPGDTTA